MNAVDLVEDYLLVWILAAVVAGFAAPELAVLTEYSTVILAVMIGSISLTLSLAEFRRVDRRSLGVVLLGHAAMPFVAFAVARALGLPPALTTGFVVLGAVTPELVTPVMTELSGGDTALSTAALVVIGVGSLAFVPAVLDVLVGGVGVRSVVIVEQLAVAVVGPMVLAVALRTRYEQRVGRYDRVYPAVSSVMVVLVMAGVAAANASIVRENLGLLVSVGGGVVAVNAAGYLLGYAVSAGGTQPTRIAATLSVGMRDFAVAAALIVAAGLPTVASLPAVAYGVVEMASSAGLARYLSRDG
ncbi:sodium-dependent transporter [Halobacterium sp. DL1]|nr:sodium-dependent transporter [Halobacterium sp. DL1]